MVCPTVQEARLLAEPSKTVRAAGMHVCLYVCMHVLYTCTCGMHVSLRTCRALSNCRHVGVYVGMCVYLQNIYVCVCVCGTCMNLQSVRSAHVYALMCTYRHASMEVLRND
jgi:hypothetical protein